VVAWCRRAQIGRPSGKAKKQSPAAPNAMATQTDAKPNGFPYRAFARIISSVADQSASHACAASRSAPSALPSGYTDGS
jgi:hypothetical protein